jgi:hypothetical protein
MFLFVGGLVLVELIIVTSCLLKLKSDFMSDLGEKHILASVYIPYKPE